MFNPQKVLVCSTVPLSSTYDLRKVRTDKKSPLNKRKSTLLQNTKHTKTGANQFRVVNRPQRLFLSRRRLCLDSLDPCTDSGDVSQITCGEGRHRVRVFDGLEVFV